MEEEISKFYNEIEKEPIRTLSREQQYPFDIPAPLIGIIRKVGQHQWICKVRYSYENGPKKGKEVMTTISVSLSIPPKSPPPPSNQ